MAITIYGASVYQEKGNPSNYRYDVLGDNSEVFTSGDVVTLEAAGTMAVGGAATTVLGVVPKTQTMASDNETVAKVHPAYTPADDTIFLMGTNSDLSAAPGSEGLYYGLTGTTGIQQVDVTSGVTSGASRIVEIVKVDPLNLGGTGAGSGLRTCLVRFVKTPYTNVTITA